MKILILGLTMALVSVTPARADGVWKASIPALVSTSQTLTSACPEWATEIKDGARVGIELVAEGTDSQGQDATARARLPGVRVEVIPHRKFQYGHGYHEWQVCRRVVYDDGVHAPIFIGCSQTSLSGNNHVASYGEPEVQFVFFWCFDTDTQTFELPQSLSRLTPAPVELPSNTPWTGLRFHIPIPLSSFTTVDAIREVRARGGQLVGDQAQVDAVILPDWADYCAYDRRTRPKEASQWLRRGVKVIWERTLHKEPDVCPTIPRTGVVD